MADHTYDLEQLANQPGTYFNPHTEVVVIVDDSTSIGQDVFDSGEFDGAQWVRVSDEVPIDESALEDALDDFQTAYHPAGESVSVAALDPDDPDDDPDLDRLDPDEEDEDD